MDHEFRSRRRRGRWRARRHRVRGLRGVQAPRGHGVGAGTRSDDLLDARYRDLVHASAPRRKRDGYLHTSFGRRSSARRGTATSSGATSCTASGTSSRQPSPDCAPDTTTSCPPSRGASLTISIVEFGPSGRPAICGHPEIEMALAEFGRATRRRTVSGTRHAPRRTTRPRAAEDDALPGARVLPGRLPGSGGRRCCAATPFARSTCRRARSTSRSRTGDDELLAAVQTAVGQHGRATHLHHGRHGRRTTRTRSSATTTSCLPTGLTPRRARASARSC